MKQIKAHDLNKMLNYVKAIEQYFHVALFT